MSATTLAPCAYCGVGTDREVTAHPTRTGSTLYLGTCEECSTLLPEEGSAVRAALRVLKRDEGEWRLAAKAFEEAGVNLDPITFEWWASQPRPGDVQPKPRRKPWQHVGGEGRAELRRGVAKMLDAKVFAAARTEDRPVPPAGPPDDTEHRACLMCGLRAQTDPWRGPVHTKAFTKPDMVSGYLCTACGEAAEAAGAVGPQALERAVMAAHGYEWTENVTIPGLKAWVATGMGPLDQPWLWVDLREPVPTLDPLVALQAALADLTARVEALEGEQP